MDDNHASAMNPQVSTIATAVARVDVREPGWLTPAHDALLRDGSVILTGTDLADQARTVGARMVRELEAMTPFASDFAVYASGHLRQYPPVDADGHVLEFLGCKPVLELCQSVLGALYIASYQGHSILPGAKTQPVHVDWEPLWPHVEQAAPTFMLAANIALDHTDSTNGSIELWPASHRQPPRDLFDAGSLRIRQSHLERRRALAPPVRANMALGEVLVRDVLTWHRGMSNSTATARPILWMLLAPRWLRAEHDDELVLPSALQPEVAKLPVPVACRFEAVPFDHLRLPT